VAKKCINFYPAKLRIIENYPAAPSFVKLSLTLRAIMRYILFAIPILFLGFLGGCVWPPDSTPTGNNQQNYYYNAAYDIHRISERSLSGSESVITLVSPLISNSSNQYYYDSIRYIIVNGDTAYRRPTVLSPSVLDSAAPYKFDGSLNVVTLIFPSSSVTDTSIVYIVAPQITSPVYGDTIQRTSDAFFGYQTDVSSYGWTFQVSDSVNYFPQSIYNSNSTRGTIDVPENELQTLQPGTLWADLTVSASVASYNTSYFDNFERTAELERVVAYPLH
jgi:hypothetical protein